MRGALGCVSLLVSGVIIIPAYAGSTLMLWPCHLYRWDHPRVCGEHVRRLTPVECERGSSPRMRGALDTLKKYYEVRRIIPAYAGSTYFRKKNDEPGGDHPRVCGEHDDPVTVRVDIPGIIPAYAGSTAFERHNRGPSKDHPRVCGEHGVTDPSSKPPKGSSPRMRGARIGGVRHGCLHGIIPAYAGSTQQAKQAGHEG